VVAILEQAFRDQWGRVLAAMIGFLGDFDLASLSLVQEGFSQVNTDATGSPSVPLGSPLVPPGFPLGATRHVGCCQMAMTESEPPDGTRSPEPVKCCQLSP
jgi:hypothetical protein